MTQKTVTQKTIRQDVGVFKVVHNGKVLYDKTKKVPKFACSISKIKEDKFASSVLTISPDPKNISVPSFA